MSLMPRRTSRRHQDSGYGLLVAAATVTDFQQAALIQRLLNDNGVRATFGLTRTPTAWGGCVHVLVFSENAHRAYEVLCHHTQ